MPSEIVWHVVHSWKFRTFRAISTWLSSLLVRHRLMKYPFEAASSSPSEAWYSLYTSFFSILGI